MNPGKLSPALLRELVGHCSRSDDILIGAAVGEDAAVVRGHPRLVVTADPITFTEEDIGTYVVAVNANDIVAMGGFPRYLTTTILVPPGTGEDRVRDVFARIGEAARKLDLLWIGGHTEVTDAVTRIVVSGHAIGTLERESTSTRAARQGDELVLTKWVALEGTTLIARERPRLVRELLGQEGLERLRGWLTDPGIAIVREGRLTARFDIGAGHDPTEGGVATGIREIAEQSGLGVSIQEEALPLREETRVVTTALGIDPLGLLSSGCYLFTARPGDAREACALLRREGVPAAVIGVMGGPGGEMTLVGPRGERPLPRFERDEILKVGGE